MRSILAIILFLVACGGGAKAIPAVAGDGGTADAALSDADTPCGDLCSSSDADAGPADAVDADAVPTDVIDADAGPTDAVDADAGPADAVDAAADVTAFACLPQYEGSVPGAHLDLSKTPCVFSISQNPSYFGLPFQVVVESSEMLTPGHNVGQCAPPDYWQYGGVGTWLRIEGTAGGTQQLWCLCDTGPCFLSGGSVEKWVATTPGVYESNFWWNGKNFQGLSDTQEKEGPAFPPGEYFFRVKADGKRKKADGTIETYAATASLKILLVP